jgi:uncharacterized coiled-coil DUF342 family protein
MQTSHLAPLLQREVRDLREERDKLRETVRQQGEFIQSLREMIRDFVYGQDASLGRLHRARH